MSIFNLISLLGGLAMFLYGMRIMGDALKESSSGPLKTALEKLTSTPIRGFLLGLAITAVIQSSTATIVLTSGLVGAGVLSLHQSLGIIVGANVGTTVTGQIIRLLDLNPGGTSILQFFQPSTLAPLAMIVGIILIMGFKPKGPVKIGEIIMGFGILFSGLLNMTDAVEVLQESGVIESLFSRLDSSPVLAYAIGAGVAFVLQSSSATVGILQAFSTSGQLTFSAIYAVLVGIYLGDCVTTAIVCNIGAKPDAKRVGITNILFNLGKTVVILGGVTALHAAGFLDGIWNSIFLSGGIANTNTIFNLVSAVLLFPLLPLFEKLSHVLVRDAAVVKSPEDEALDALNPVFFSTPAVALGRCYDALTLMFQDAQGNVVHAFDLLARYDTEVAEQVKVQETQVDVMADRISNYLVQMAPHITAPNQVEILNQYDSIVNEFERLSDHAENMAEIAGNLERGEKFPPAAVNELSVLRLLTTNLLELAGQTFRRRDVEAARHIEPLVQVMDDMVETLRNHRLKRLKSGEWSVAVGTEFLNLLTEVQNLAGICSNIGMATIARVYPEIQHEIHTYLAKVHSGQDEAFNQEYQEVSRNYFALL